FVNRVTARHLHRTVLLATVLMPGACYHYVPATEVSSGAQVRARLTVEGTDSLVRRFGPGVAEVTGTMLSRDEEGVSVLVSEYYSERSGSRAIWNEAVRLPSAGVAAVEERRLHVARSALFGAAVLGGVGLLAVALD